ncbi:hypothetical protein [uncultured Ramlibacter sp.]|uniref:hypothetical protein n=1 Tax=uncultured Ramlibacter sp. TaxID=260755 RepID=UPI00262B1D00|nr:hypothetical protein [uncultured Ramlibacter sp.]
MQIYAGTDAHGLVNAAPAFIGALVVDKMGAIASYKLLDMTSGGPIGQAVARLARYSRWSEPGLALASRLIERTDSDILVRRLQSLPVVMELCIGPSVGVWRVVERLSIAEQHGRLQAELSSDFRSVQVAVPPLPVDVTVGDALVSAARWVFDWHPGIPAIPAPLTEIPLTNTPGGVVVALADIPHHPRCYFVQQMGLADWPPTAPVRRWWRFIGEDPRVWDSRTVPGVPPSPSLPVAERVAPVLALGMPESTTSKENRMTIEEPPSEHVKQLRDAYPRLLQTIGPVGMWFPPGWTRVVEDLCKALDALLTDAQAAQFQVEQVKEKYGSLRFYYSVAGQADAHVDIHDRGAHQHLVIPAEHPAGYPIAAIDVLIAKAEQETLITCASCGAPGTLREAGWHHVSCEQCEKTVWKRK